MFNVFVADGTQEPPSDDVFYVVAGNGIFIRKKLGILDALVPAKAIPHLNHVKPYAVLDIPKIPADDFAKIVSFFRKVYDEYKSEAIGLLHYSEKKRDFKVQIPFQEVTGGSVDYKRTSPWQSQGYILMCTIHSHAGFGAFHSGIDDSDEKYFDGLHITVGDLSKELHTISTSVVVNGMRFIVDTHDYVDGVESVDYCNYHRNIFRPSFQMKDGIKVYEKFSKSQIGFFVANIPFEPTWMEFVEKKTPIVHIWTPQGSGRINRGRVQSPADPSELPHGSWLPYWYRHAGDYIFDPQEYDPLDGLEPDEGGGGFFTGHEGFYQQQLPLNTGEEGCSDDD
jgi:hypothetical protein